jgi:hypothetical protein
VSQTLDPCFEKDSAGQKCFGTTKALKFRSLPSATGNKDCVRQLHIPAGRFVKRGLIEAVAEKFFRTCRAIKN